jgi:hypothetical protein
MVALASRRRKSGLQCSSQLGQRAPLCMWVPCMRPWCHANASVTRCLQPWFGCPAGPRRNSASHAACHMPQLTQRDATSTSSAAPSVSLLKAHFPRPLLLTLHQRWCLLPPACPSERTLNVTSQLIVRWTTSGQQGAGQLDDCSWHTTTSLDSAFRVLSGMALSHASTELNWSASRGEAPGVTTKMYKLLGTIMASLQRTLGLK